MTPASPKVGIRRPFVLAWLSIAAVAGFCSSPAFAQPVNLVELEQAPAYEAKTQPVISQLRTWRIQKIGDMGMGLALAESGGSDGKPPEPARFAVTIPAVDQARAFTVSFTVELVGGGWLGFALRGQGSQYPWVGVGRSAEGHGKVETSDNQSVGFEVSSGMATTEFQVSNDPASQTVQVVVDQREPITVPYPAGFGNVSTLTLDLVDDKHLCTGVSISNLLLTFKD